LSSIFWWIFCDVWIEYVSEPVFED